MSTKIESSRTEHAVAEPKASDAPASPASPEAVTESESETKDLAEPELVGVDAHLIAQLPTFEIFFKTVGFKRVHGRVWGFLVLAGRPLSSRQIYTHLKLSQGSTSTCLNELIEWGAITSEFDGERRCHLHSPVNNALSIVATVFRRREQVVFGKFRRGATRTLNYVREQYGERDPRVLTLRSIITSCELAEAVMQLVFSSVERALGDGESILAKAVNTALRIGLTVPGKLMPMPPVHLGNPDPSDDALLELDLDADPDGEGDDDGDGDDEGEHDEARTLTWNEGRADG
jgi:hypothetical protein